MNSTPHADSATGRATGGPGFRWNLAQRFASSERSCWAERLDKPTQQATDYLRRVAEVGDERARLKYPTVSAACALCSNEPVFAMLRVALAGRLTAEEIASRLGTTPEVITLAEQLFFDLGRHRHAASWLHAHVFRPEVIYGSGEVAARIRLALAGGPATTRALLNGREQFALEQAQRVVHQEGLLYAKFQAALEFDLNADSAQEFLKNYFDYEVARQQLALEQDKLAKACATANNATALLEAPDRGGVIGSDQVGSPDLVAETTTAPQTVAPQAIAPQTVAPQITADSGFSRTDAAFEAAIEPNQ